MSFWNRDDQRILDVLAVHGAALLRIENNQRAASLQEKTEMISITALTDAVARETTVDQSIVTLVTKLAAGQKDLAAQLKEALAANDPVMLAAVQKAIDDSATQMSANADNIVAAITANT